MSQFVKRGHQMVRAPPGDPLVTAHAARRPNGDLAVLLINKDPDAAHDVALSYSGYTPSAAAPTVVSDGNGDTGIHAGDASVLPAYSITLLTLHPNAGNAAAPNAP